jgi:DNA-binding response OmpR family regulator
MKALLVEDSPTCAKAGKATLEALGYQVTTRSCASAARGSVARLSYDLYVVDAGIPENLYGRAGDGLLLVRWIRYNEPRARVIVWSADKGNTMKALELGAWFAWKEDQEALERVVRNA